MLGLERNEAVFSIPESTLAISRATRVQIHFRVAGECHGDKRPKPGQLGGMGFSSQEGFLRR